MFFLPVAARQSALSISRRNPNNLASLWEEEHSQSRADGFRVQVSSEDASNESVGSMSSDDSSPGCSELALVGILSPIDLANSLSEIPSGSLSIIDSFDLNKSLVSVLSVSGSMKLEKFSCRGSFH